MVVPPSDLSYLVETSLFADSVPGQGDLYLRVRAVAGPGRTKRWGGFKELHLLVGGVSPSVAEVETFRSEQAATDTG